MAYTTLDRLYAVFLYNIKISWFLTELWLFRGAPGAVYFSDKRLYSVVINVFFRLGMYYTRLAIFQVLTGEYFMHLQMIFNENLCCKMKLKISALKFAKDLVIRLVLQQYAVIYCCEWCCWTVDVVFQIFPVNCW